MPEARGALRRAGVPVRVGILVAVAAVVLGILGMHALSLHGTAATGASPAGGLHAVSDHTPAEATTATADAPDGEHDSGHGGAGHDAVMLCVAMLAAAAGMLLALAGLRHRAPPVWAELPAALALRVTARARPGGTGPPPVWEFSVVRC